MLIRFKNRDGYVRIYNTENIREMRPCYDGFNKPIVIITGNDNEQHYWHCRSRERAIEALDKIYDAYADGARAVTIETDDI